MRGLKNRMVTIGIATLVMAGSLGVIGAAPASAEDGFAPSLTTGTAVAKFTAVAERPTSLTTPAAKATVTIATESSSIAKATRPATATRTKASGDEARARMLLKRYINQYPILQGATVSFGDARGYQAISYYQSGRIVISKSHSASLERIIAHEIWHIIDWRDNGRIDWGENVPPKK